MMLRSLCAFVAGVCVAIGLAGPVRAQDYPARPVKVVIAFSPAGAIDIPMGSSIGNIRSGKMRALALSGPARSKLVPEVPTLTEVGINMPEESSWYGFFAPKGTPKAVIEKVNKDIQAVLQMPDMREREVQYGYRYVGGSPEKLGAFLKAEIEKWDRLAKKGAFQTN